MNQTFKEIFDEIGKKYVDGNTMSVMFNFQTSLAGLEKLNNGFK